MSFTHKNARADFSGILPLWVEQLQQKFPNTDFSSLREADLDDDYPRIIITFPSQFHADRAIDKCGLSLRANWPNSQIIYRFRHWNPPACKVMQGQVLRRYDPTHADLECRVCTTGYGCR